MYYDNKIIAALQQAGRALAHRDLVTLLDPESKDYAAFNNIGLALTRMYRAGILDRTFERRDNTQHRYYAYTLKG